MADQREPPYVCHIFVCTNDRHGERKSCADHNGAAIRATLKQGVADRGWRGRVRVSQSGCLGLCEDGPNVILYPQKIWFSAVTEDDCSSIMDAVAALLPI